ncbi:MAG: hypothetical protein EBU63_09265, partial [Alphaproteobacteria bacterium]|nr:hypothetical protein [Alphaproteobacteria bacterium]
DTVDVINSGTYDVDATDTIQSLSGSGAVQIATGVTLTTGDAGSDTISGVISGAGHLTKAGAGTLTLSATNTFSGDLTISAGTVTMTGTLADTVDVINSGTYDVDASDTINSLSGSGAVEIATSQTLTTGDTGDDTISGVISGAGNLTKAGAGTLTLSATNTFSGDLTISAGTVTMTGTLADTVDVINSGTYDVDASDTIQSLSGSGAVQIADSVTLTTGDAGDDTISGVISGAGNLTKAGAGTLTLSGTNTFSGDLTISALSITNNAALGTTAGITTVASGAALHLSNNITVAEAITISGTGISTNGAIRNVSDSNTLSGLITLAADSEIQIDSGSTLAMNVASGSAITGTYNLTIESVGTSSIADPIATSTGNLTKTGAGTLTLSGTNTFSGDLTISAGTVTMTGTLADTVDVINSGTYDVDASDTIQSLSGSGA